MACESKVIQLPPRKAASSPSVTRSRSRITIHVGAQRYAMDITCEANGAVHLPVA